MTDRDVVVQSMVQLPSPPPPGSKRKRSTPSRTPSPGPPSPRRRRRSRSPRHPFGRLARPDLPELEPERARSRERQLANRLKVQEEPKKPAESPLDAKAQYEKLMSMRSGGTYIPPARLRALQAQITDKSTKEYQRMAWEALKKSINGLINKINTGNIKHIVPELFGENLIRGRGLYCRSIMKAQAASLPFTPIYAAMTAIVNTKLPQVGQLLLNRLVVQFRKAFRRNDKGVCLSSTTFIAHLCNQQVAHEIVIIEILFLLLNKPTDDSVEIAVGLMREAGAHLEESEPRANNAVFEQFRTILHEANIDKRVQYMIEVLFEVRKDRYKDNPAVKDELDLVEEEDQITHRTDLDDEIDVLEGLNIFKFDANWEEHEKLYARTKAEILGEVSDEESGDEDDSSNDEDEDEQDEKQKHLEIQDQSNTNLVNLRRTIYLTVMSSIDFEECCHKLMKITIPVGQEMELCSMIVECCSQERTFSKFYGLIGERFAKLNRLWNELFEESFRTYFDTIHRYETNRLRNIAKFFGHMLASDALGWHVFSVVHLNEEETTASSRIFVKILFQDLAEIIGMKKLVERLKDPFMQEAFGGLFPKDNPRNTRFAINYFTSVGMGALTEDMREWLKVQSAQKQAEALESAVRRAEESDSMSSTSRSSYTTRSRSRSISKSRGKGRSDSRSRSRSRSYDSYSSRSRSYSSSRSRSPIRGRGRRHSRSITPKKGKRRAQNVSSSRSISRSTSRSALSSRSPSSPRRGRHHKSYSLSLSPSHSRSLSTSSRSRSPPLRRRRLSYSSSPPRRSGRQRSLPRSPVIPPRRVGYSPGPSSRPLRRSSPTYNNRSSRSPISGAGRIGREDGYRDRGRFFGRSRGTEEPYRDRLGSRSPRSEGVGSGSQVPNNGDMNRGRHGVRAVDFL